MDTAMVEKDMDKVEVVPETANEILRNLLLHSGMKIRDIARQTNVSEDTLYRIAQNKTRSDTVNIQLFNTLAKFFGYDLTIFVEGDNYQKPYRLTPPEEDLIAAFRRLDPKMYRRAIDLVKTPPEPLSAQERQILDMVLKLNTKGQARVKEFCDDLLSTAKYNRGGGTA